MNRKISICIIIAAAGLLAFAVFHTGKEKGMSELPDSETAEETQLLEETAAGDTAVYSYILRECDGRVVVYRPNSEEIYMETGILTEYLPEDIRVQLSDGIGFTSEERMFDFLESYSS